MANPTYVILLLAAIVQLNEGFGYDATVLVGAGKKECYYQHITQPNTAVEFEYQVLDQTPINFQIKSPTNVFIVADIRRPNNVIPLHLKDVGLYEICILNRYSNAQKSVYLGLYSESADETWPFNHREQVEDKVDEAEIIMDMASSEIIRSIDGMSTSAEKMRFLQQSIRTSNVKDYIVQRANRSRVDWFSAGQLIIMVTASVVQVLTIRHLFGDQSAKSHNMKIAT